MRAATLLILLLAITCSIVVAQEAPTNPSPQTSSPPPQSTCTLQDQSIFLSVIHNAGICGPSIGTVFTPPMNDSTALNNALDKVCTNECGGLYSQYLATISL